METITFYHYTNESGKDAIVKEGKIRQTDGARDAPYGLGVYGTGLAPSELRKKIAWNNWDGVVNIKEGMLIKATWAIKAMVPRSLVKEVESNRDVLIYTGGDLVLGHYEVIPVN